MAALVVHGIEGLRALVGHDLPPTPWLKISQRKIDAFAACTGDNQWPHVDVDRARKSTFGSTIAHGYLILSLVPLLWHRACDVRDTAATINYGIDRLRFTSPVESGANIRACFRIVEASDTSHGLRTILQVTIEKQHASKPVCLANIIFLFQPMGAE
ncbi:MAG: MaoC family dehydratase [Vulcanimicrobiaceae bacterium]